MRYLLLFFCVFTLSCHQNPKGNKLYQTTLQPGAEWFRDAKFGMFIHWGPYSVLEGEWNGRQVPVGENAEWIMQKLKIPAQEYRKAAAAFNPVKFNATDWVSLAKEAGMKYLVITAKHHDGFAMYHSKVSKYNIVDYTPFKRDPLQELSEACRKEGIKFCVYYSHREDWDHPYAYGNTWDYNTSQTNLDSMDHPGLFRKYLDEKSLPQVKELLTNYGPLGLIWFDRGMYTQEQGKEFADFVHSLQPDCLVNGRVGHYFKELLGDYQSLSDNGMPAGGIEEYWESPQTLNETWGYSKFDTNWKTAGEIIRRLVIIAGKGGNYLLNIGPTGEGVIPLPSVEVLKKAGAWMHKNGESIYGTSPSPFNKELDWGTSTCKGSLIYLHVFRWPENNILELNGLKNKVRKAWLLSDKGSLLPFKKVEHDGLKVYLPEGKADSINTVVVIETVGIPETEHSVIEQRGNDPVRLDYLSATTCGNAAKRFNRKGGYHIARMQTPDDRTEWRVAITNPGTYEVLVTYATSPEWERSPYYLKSGNEILSEFTVIKKEWFEYQTLNAGQMQFTSPGEKLIQLYPASKLANQLMYLKSVELRNIRDDISSRIKEE